MADGRTCLKEKHASVRNITLLQVNINNRFFLYKMIDHHRRLIIGFSSKMIDNHRRLILKTANHDDSVFNSLSR